MHLLVGASSPCLKTGDRDAMVDDSRVGRLPTKTRRATHADVDVPHDTSPSVDIVRFFDTLLPKWCIFLIAIITCHCRNFYLQLLRMSVHLVLTSALTFPVILQTPRLTKANS